VTRRCLNAIRDRKTRERLLAMHDDTLRGPVRTSCEQRTVDLDLLVKLEDELDPLSCEILVYRFVDDMTQDEIARVVGKSRKTVGKRLDGVRQAVAKLGALPGGAA
jgi:RNA polymerase sigma-70 factor (ECF subfamily)